MVAVEDGLDMSGVMLGVGPLKGVGVGDIVGATVVCAVGVGVVVCFETNQVQVDGLNSVVLTLVGAA